jgi:membrane protein
MPTRPSPWRLGGLGFRKLAARVWEAANVDEIGYRAAALSYYFLFSIFPLLLFTTLIVRLLPLDHVIGQFMDTAARVVPPEALAMVRATLRQVLSRGEYRGLVSLGALTAVWVGSAGMASFMTMLNVVYDVTDHRSWLRRRVIAVVLTVVFAVFLVVSTLLLMMSERIERLGTPLATVIAVLLVLTAIDLIYHFAPAQRERWRWMTPGSVTATALWLAASFGLRVYVAHFGNYDLMYGSIGGLILFLVWLYLTSLVLLLGAEVNAAIAHAGAAADATAQRARRVARVVKSGADRPRAG